MHPELKACKTLTGTFFFDPEDRIYTEHFPGNPVVPGSMIVHAFLLAAQSFLSCRGASSIENFRFRKFVRPGEYAYRIEPAGKNLKCSLLDPDAQPLATGTLNL
jgi:3-hydroxyacyl-[acyl-carrier-protein] dehydratase